MKVIITRNTVAQKKPVFVGDVLDLSIPEALSLINLGKARVIPEAQQVEDREADIDISNRTMHLDIDGDGQADVEVSVKPKRGKKGNK